MRAPSRALGLASLGGLLHGLAMPGAGFPGAEWLVFVGIAIFAETALRSSRPVRDAFVFGLLHYAWSSASLRHPLLPGYVLIVGIGACYFAVMAFALRRLARRAGPWRAPLAGALLWALYEVVKSQIPEIYYPHAQSAHALYAWPALLQPVALLGESFQNLLVAGAGFGLWALLRAERRTGAVQLAVVLGSWLVTSWIPTGLPAQGAPLHVALVQTCRPSYPDQAGGEILFDSGRSLEERFGWLLRRYHERGAEIRGEGEPDLVVWPESTFSFSVRAEDLEHEVARLARLLPGDAPRLFGAVLRVGGEGEEGEDRVAAFFVDAEGRLQGHHEKRILVPAGERLPFFVRMLPRGWVRGIRNFVAGFLGGRPPNVSPGEEQELLELEGRRFAAAICYENAFPQPFAEAARRGAGFVVVVSHEGWYRGGSELEQLLAATVFRALECGRPVLRGTTDGVTASVDANGRLQQRLPIGRPGVLHARVQPRSGATFAVAWGLRVPWLYVLVLLALALPTKRAKRAPDVEFPEVDS